MWNYDKNYHEPQSFKNVVWSFRELKFVPLVDVFYITHGKDGATTSFSIMEKTISPLTNLSEAKYEELIAGFCVYWIKQFTKNYQFDSSKKKVRDWFAILSFWVVWKMLWNKAKCLIQLNL